MTGSTGGGSMAGHTAELAKKQAPAGFECFPAVSLVAGVKALEAGDDGTWRRGCSGQGR
jgi:hypothetical protein